MVNVSWCWMRWWKLIVYTTSQRIDCKTMSSIFLVEKRDEEIFWNRTRVWSNGMDVLFWRNFIETQRMRTMFVCPYGTSAQQRIRFDYKRDQNRIRFESNTYETKCNITDTTVGYLVLIPHGFLLFPDHHPSIVDGSDVVDSSLLVDDRLYFYLGNSCNLLA